MSNTMFEVATRNRYRFPYKGLITVEDLWDLTVKELDTIFKALNSQVKQAKEESLLETRSQADVELDTQIEIIKHIVSVKQEETSSRKKDKENAEKKQQLLSILANKENEALLNKSPEELKKMIEELG